MESLRLMFWLHENESVSGCNGSTDNWNSNQGRARWTRAVSFVSSDPKFRLVETKKILVHTEKIKFTSNMQRWNMIGVCVFCGHCAYRLGNQTSSHVRFREDFCAVPMVYPLIFWKKLSFTPGFELWHSIRSG